MKITLLPIPSIIIKLTTTLFIIFTITSCTYSGSASTVESSKQDNKEYVNIKQKSISEKPLNVPRLTLSNLKKNYGTNYLYYNFDINADGIKDLIVTVDPKKADKVKDELDTLYIYIAENDNNFGLSLKSTNFSSDGGNSFLRVSPRINRNGFIISTYFPDRGTFFQDYYVKLSKNNSTAWFLEKEVEKGEFMNYEGNISYYCDYPQNDTNLEQNFDLKGEEFSDEEKKVKCPSPPTQYVVSAQKVNILNENFENNNPPNYFIKGDKVEAIEQNDDWIRIMYKNDKKSGWISKKDLKVLNKNP